MLGAIFDKWWGYPEKKQTKYYLNIDKTLRSFNS